MSGSSEQVTAVSPSGASTAPPPARPAGRFHFIDALRGWAVLVMIETHVVNALLLSAIKDESPFKVLTFVNGLVAPSFLFCAGLAFAISLNRRWQEFAGLGRPFGRMIVRALFILGVAYSLHIPFFSLARMKTVADQTLWISFFQVDILQVIGITFLLLSILVVMSGKESRFASLAGLTGVLIVFASPIVRELDWSGSPIWLRAYFTNHYKSQFPLFPWMSFLLAGTVIGNRFVAAVRAGTEDRFMRTAGILALSGIVISMLAEWIPLTLYPNHDFWRASPEFFFVRLGLVVLLLVLLWRAGRGRQPAQWSVIGLLGQESLLVYVVHLLIVYGYTYDWSFVRKFGPTLTYAGCAGLFAGLTVAMVLLAAVWHWMKKWNMRVAVSVRFAVISGIILWFILKPV